MEMTKEKMIENYLDLVKDIEKKRKDIVSYAIELEDVEVEIKDIYSTHYLISDEKTEKKRDASAYNKCMNDTRYMTLLKKRAELKRKIEHLKAEIEAMEYRLKLYKILLTPKE